MNKTEPQLFNNNKIVVLRKSLRTAESNEIGTKKHKL
jgi:hypothetical protein